MTYTGICRGVNLSPQKLFRVDQHLQKGQSPRLDFNSYYVQNGKFYKEFNQFKHNQMVAERSTLQILLSSKYDYRVHVTRNGLSCWFYFFSLSSKLQPTNSNILRIIRLMSYCQFWIYWVGVNTKFTQHDTYLKYKKHILSGLCR